ncbi:efflux RND transporter periplasmic adaptor subunit [Rhodovibrio salinarum]|uniref:Efflux RND transporter periplasmic adaptor subunit n=1 Tax=Rhodovibrio salinarum TaxID=1087 RepID=A0A934QGN0_9PROT|nr:efflux RND transporter periplasmic adaptor subunit [Rhodovibrio salinarum]MBK1696444.1 efflux RND transporter periplasmic adaptor subunit [Rhodovibrio salinarum]
MPDRRARPKPVPLGAGLLAFVLAATFGLAGAGVGHAQEAASESAGTKARTFADTPSLNRLLDPEDGRVSADGTLGAYEARALIEPRAEAILSSEIGGRILKLPVEEGERFAKGDVLVAFDCSFHQAELRAARAELTRAQHTLENKEQLARLNSVGQLEVALARADVAKAQAQVQTRQLYIDRCRLTAPYDGRVVERPVNVYETVGKDQELMSVIAAGDLKIRLIVPSRWLAWLTDGQSFQLTIDETGSTHRAQVTTIGARIDPVSQTVPIKGTLRDHDRSKTGLLPGMSGTAQFAPPSDG